MIFIDSSVFLILYLDEPGADSAKEILENVETNNVEGIITPLVLEEVTFKVIFAEASRILNTRNIWKIRNALKRDPSLRREISNVLKKVKSHIDALKKGGLRVVDIHPTDWYNGLNYVIKYGTLPADSIHLAVMERLNINTIATFDDDFRLVEGINVIPSP